MEAIETLNKSVKLQSDGKVSVDASDHADDLLDVGYMEYGYVRGCLLVLFFLFLTCFLLASTIQTLQMLKFSSQMSALSAKMPN